MTMRSKQWQTKVTYIQQRAADRVGRIVTVFPIVKELAVHLLRLML
jgi:hypothetical protein